MQDQMETRSNKNGANTNMKKKRDTECPFCEKIICVKYYLRKNLQGEIFFSYASFLFA